MTTSLLSRVGWCAGALALVAGCQPHFHFHYECGPVVAASQPGGTEGDVSETPGEILKDALKGVNP